MYQEHFGTQDKINEKNKEIRTWTKAGIPSRKSDRTRGNLVIP